MNTYVASLSIVWPDSGRAGRTENAKSYGNKKTTTSSVASTQAAFPKYTQQQNNFAETTVRQLDGSKRGCDPCPGIRLSHSLIAAAGRDSNGRHKSLFCYRIHTRPRLPRQRRILTSPVDPLCQIKPTSCHERNEPLDGPNPVDPDVVKGAPSVGSRMQPSGTEPPAGTEGGGGLSLRGPAIEGRAGRMGPAGVAGWVGWLRTIR